MVSIIENPEEYNLIPYVEYKRLEDKMEALLSGETLLIKNFEKASGGHVLVRLERLAYDVTKISYDIFESVHNPRYWVTFNVGINDLSLFTVFRYDDALLRYESQFIPTDMVAYMSVDGQQDSAIVEEVYVSNDGHSFAYRLSRDPGVLYPEEKLVSVKTLVNYK